MEESFLATAEAPRPSEGGDKVGGTGGQSLVASTGWAAMARKDPAEQPKLDISSILSSAGLNTVVVDANALIGGGVRLHGIADQYFTIKEVLEEVRDPASRFYVATLPLEIRCLEPSDEALAAVVKFARATGDLRSLSDVDLKVIALAYTLEAQVHGIAHIRSRPPPLLVTRSSTHRQPNPPGWGTVDNPEEWEGIDKESAGPKTESRILGLKTLNLELPKSIVHEDSVPDALPASVDDRNESLGNVKENGTPTNHVDGSSPLGGQAPEVHQIHSIEAKNKESGGRLRPWKPTKDEPKSEPKQMPDLEGNLNVTRGVDASKGLAEEDGDDWTKATSRSTRRNCLKRQIRRESKRQASEIANAELPYTAGDEETNSVLGNSIEGLVGEAHISTVDLDPSVDADSEEFRSLKNTNCGGSEDENAKLRDFDHEDIRLFDDGAENGGDASMAEDVTSNVDDTSSLHTDGVESEQSWMLGPLWKSTVACMTGDYAMQNVLLQMGLRLLSVAGKHVQELNKWVLKCQACNRVTSDVGRIFCPTCGNGGTLFKVSVTVGENGTVHAGRTRRINLRGTRYSLPMPKGGREGAVLNPILREDQLPNRLLHPRARKIPVLDDFSSSDIIFTVAQEKNGQKLTGIKTAAAIFGGRRNPNERRGARSR